MSRANRLEVAVVLLYTFKTVEDSAEKGIIIYGKLPPPTEMQAMPPFSSWPLLHLRNPAV
jgi:hypothetical protein